MAAPHFPVAAPAFDAPELCLMFIDRDGQDYYARLHVERRGEHVNFRIVGAAGHADGRVLCSGSIDPESIRDLVATLTPAPSPPFTAGQRLRLPDGEIRIDRVTDDAIYFVSFPLATTGAPLQMTPAVFAEAVQRAATPSTTEPK